MIGIIDYGMGNLHSVKNAFDKLQIEALISSDPKVLEQCSHLVLPGVGAFKDMMQNLQAAGLDGFIKDQVLNQDKKLLGICLGMQALYDDSHEKGHHKGLALLKGSVVPMKSTDKDPIRIPQIGWNELQYQDSKHPLARLLGEDTWYYFDHSYYADDIDPDQLLCYVDYGQYKIPAVVAGRNILAVQGHPEKSGKKGLDLLKWFAEEMK